jgi:hypothetical protein
LALLADFRRSTVYTNTFTRTATTGAVDIRPAMSYQNISITIWRCAFIFIPVLASLTNYTLFLTFRITTT